MYFNYRAIAQHSEYVTSGQNKDTSVLENDVSIAVVERSNDWRVDIKGPNRAVLHIQVILLRRHLEIWRHTIHKIRLTHYCSKGYRNTGRTNRWSVNDTFHELSSLALWTPLTVELVFLDDLHRVVNGGELTPIHDRRVQLNVRHHDDTHNRLFHVLKVEQYKRTSFSRPGKDRTTSILFLFHTAIYILHIRVHYAVQGWSQNIRGLIKNYWRITKHKVAWTK